MANSTEVTFEDFQTSERFKKLERSLKLAILKKAPSKSVHKKEMLLPVTAWPSISSINVDSMNSSYVTPSLHTSVVKSEVLASSNTLRHLFSTKRNCKTNREIMATSSVKQDDCSDRLVMPPPMRNTVYRISKETQDKVPTLPNCKTVMSNPLNRSVQSSTVNSFSLSATSQISANTNTSKEYPYPFVAPTIPAIDPQRINRSFSRWRVMLNDNYELIIKGTLECGRVTYSKPVIRRYNATCVESKYKYKYNLQGHIVDERNVLPDYIRGKFYNGFPDDWENVYQIWRTYVSQGCPVTFRWPTPITDSDDDLKSELTELTFICTKNKKDIFKESCESFEYSSNKFENPNDQVKSSKKKRKYNCSTHSFQSCKENTSLVKPLISKKDIIPIVQTRNIKSACNTDNEQNTELDVNPVYSSRGMKKKDIIYEDKLKIIIDNLADRNCSPKYIDKVIEMFNCLDYTVSYRAKSECDYNSAISANHETSCKQEMLQANLACDNNHTDNKFENEIKEKGKNYRNSIDLRDRSINNDSNLTQLSNPINVKPKHDGNNDSDESESLTYVGVPKISIERVLHARKASRKTYKHKVRKKPANSSNIKAIEYEFESAPTTILMANNKKSLFSDESCISITEDEVKDEIDMTKYHKIKNIVQRSQEDSFNSHLMRNNFDVYDTNNPAMQNKQSFNPFQIQKINLNASIKEQEISHKVEKNAHSQFIADIDYASNSGIDVETVSTNTRKTDGNMIASHSNLDQDIVISSESNNNFSKKPLVFQESHREYIGQSKNEIAMKKSKPSIISLMPGNLKLKIKEADFKSEQLQPLDVHIVESEKDKYFNIQSLEEICKNKLVSKASIATTKAIIANDSHLKTTEIEKADNKKKIYLTTNKKNESNVNSTNLTNPAMEQFKSNKLEIKNNSKVLSAWMPKVIYYAKSKSELGLIFEGKLLNELGHVVQRKFTTDIVLKRLSATLIETVNHDFYELIGCLNDNKHVIPKELAKQCHNGCPANVEQFCLTWKMLQNCKIQKMSEKLNNTSMDSLNTSVSSRGRRIVPPLSYWTGERITVKDNNLVYNPGNSQESSLVSTIETSKEAIKETTKKLSTRKTKKQKANSKNISKEQKLFKSNEIPNTNKNEALVIEKSQSSNKSYKTKTANNTKRSYKSHKSRKSRINGKRYIKQNLTFSSTDSSEKEQDVSPRKRMRTHLNMKTGAPSQYTMTLRKRQNKDIPE